VLIFVLNCGFEPVDLAHVCCSSLSQLHQMSQQKRSPGTLVSDDVWFSQKSPGEGTLNKSAAINLRGDRDEPVYNEIHRCHVFSELADLVMFCVLGNHSCSPNAEITFPNNSHILTVKALSHIKSGEVCFEFLFFFHL